VNEQCSTAQALRPGETVTADTTGAKPHGLEHDECSLHSYSRGTFYKVAGTGRDMAVTVTATEIYVGTRMEIAVLEDVCDSDGQCVEVSDFLDVEDMPFTLPFSTTAGKNYVVVVSGERFSDAGSFQITMEVRAWTLFRVTDMARTI